MKTKSLFFLLLVFITTTLFAQKDYKKFGQVSLSDFNFDYKKDTTADAIVLSDIGNVEFVFKNGNSGFEIKFVRTKRILIKNKAGLSYADVSIPFYVDGRGQTERIKDLKANTYYLVNGSLQQKSLSKSEIFTEKSSERWSQKKFAFPNAVEGAIIEYTYTLFSPFIFQLPDWEFQTSIPTVYSSYTFGLVPFYDYVYLLQGADKFDAFTKKESKGLPRSIAGVSFNDVIYTALMKDIPAFEDESYISSVDDYIMKIDFQLAGVNNPDGTRRDVLTTYPKLIKALMEHDKFGKYLKKAQKETKNTIAKQLNLSGKSELQKAETIINFVKNNYDFNGEYRKYAEFSAKEVIKKKRGNSAELNLLLMTLLNNAGLNASPVIYSTRDHGKIHKAYPFDHQFNSVLIFVETSEKKFLTDATEQLTAFDRIPLASMNDQGLVIKEGPDTWVNMYSKISSKSTRKIMITPDVEEEKMRITVHGSMTEVEGYIYRNIYEDKATLIEEALADEGYENIQDIKIENFRKMDQPYKLIFSAELPMESFDDKILITPFLTYPPTENLLKQKTRTYPVDFIYKRTTNFGSQIEIPEGYQVLELPEKVMVNDDLVQIAYSPILKDNLIKITGSVVYKKAQYKAADYAKIKGHIDTIVEKFNEPIVLELVED